MAIIDEVCIAKYGGKLKNEYTISGVPLENHYHKGVRQSGFILLNQATGLKEISITIVFQGQDRSEIDKRKVLFDSLLMGKNELVLDGFFYTVLCQSIGESIYKGFCVCEARYDFIGVKHGNLQTVMGKTLYCMSTLPATDCRISVTVSASAQFYQVGSVTFKDVSAGDKLVVDGLNKRILVNDAPAAQKAEWVRFPSLSPGGNSIQCVDIPTIEYYPVFF